MPRGRHAPAPVQSTKISNTEVITEAPSSSASPCTVLSTADVAAAATADSTRRRPPSRRTARGNGSSGNSSSNGHCAPAIPRSLPVHNGLGMSDHELASLAMKTAGRIDWDCILHMAGSGAAQWKWLETTGGVSIYARHEPQRHAVLATAILPCSVGEVAQLVAGRHTYQHVQCMEALYGEQFKDGAVVRDIDCDADPSLAGLVNPSYLDTTLASLTVKTTAFAKPGWFGSDEGWCYLDAVRRQRAGDYYEKITTTLWPQDVLGSHLGCSGYSHSSGGGGGGGGHGKHGSDGASGATRYKFLRDVVTGFVILPETPVSRASSLDRSVGNPVPRASRRGHGGHGSTPPTSARVHFYAEHAAPIGVHMVSSRFAFASDRVIHNRLLFLAQSCRRLEQLIRRRRMGHQVIIDVRRILPPTNCRCVVCDRRVLVAKLCKLCGFGVCEGCSGKHEREWEVRGSIRLQVERIRVCDSCLDRVDHADYSRIYGSRRMLAAVEPDPIGSVSSKDQLTSLLEEALLSAPLAKKRSVLSVIQALLEQDLAVLDDREASSSSVSLSRPRSSSQASSLASSSSASSSKYSSVRSLSTSLHSEPVSEVSSVRSSEVDALDALDHWELETLPIEATPLANSELRSYQIDTRDPRGAFPLPPNERQRVQLIQDSQVRELGQCEELNIICSLAATEMSCCASMVTIVDADELYVLACSDPTFVAKTYPRRGGLCAHTIMDDKPIIFPHPEADVRFHSEAPWHALGVKYYCGFPLFANDPEQTVIGSVCCLNNETTDMTASQYTVLSKLASTAAKIVRARTSPEEQRRRSFRGGVTKQQPNDVATAKTTNGTTTTTACSAA